MAFEKRSRKEVSSQAEAKSNINAATFSTEAESSELFSDGCVLHKSINGQNTIQVKAHINKAQLSARGLVITHHNGITRLQ